MTWTTKTGPESEDRDPEYTASLRVGSTTLAAAEISRRLGTPTRSFERGEPLTSRYPDGAKREESLWNLNSEVDRGERLDKHVEVLLAFLDAHREDVAALRDECEIDIFCAVHANDDINCSFVVKPELSRRIAEWEIPLVVCCF